MGMFAPVEEPWPESAPSHRGAVLLRCMWTSHIGVKARDRRDSNHARVAAVEGCSVREAEWVRWPISVVEGIAIPANVCGVYSREASIDKRWNVECIHCMSVFVRCTRRRINNRSSTLRGRRLQPCPYFLPPGLARRASCLDLVVGFPFIRLFHCQLH